VDYFLPQQISVFPLRVRCGRSNAVEFVSIAEAAGCVDMTPRTIEWMIAAGTLTGYVEWDEIEAKLLPARQPHHQR